MIFHVQLRRWSALATQPPRDTDFICQALDAIVKRSKTLFYIYFFQRATPSLNWDVFCCSANRSWEPLPTNDSYWIQCSGIVMMSASSHELVRFSVTAAKEVWRLHVNAWHSFSKNKHQQPYKHLTGTGGKSRNSDFVDKVSAYDVFDPEKWPCSR